MPEPQKVTGYGVAQPRPEEKIPEGSVPMSAPIPQYAEDIDVRAARAEEEKKARK